MTLPTYEEILKMGKEALDAAKAPFKVKQAKKQAELHLLTMEEQLLTLESKVNEAATKSPIDFDKILDAQDEQLLLERRIEKFKQLMTTLFPEEK